MPANIANYFEADRRSATAGEDLAFGQVCKVSDDGAGGRLMHKLADTDSALLVYGKYALAHKVSVDPYSVTTSTALLRTGNRVESILSGDAIIECRRGTIYEYPADSLDASLDPARSGTTPTVGTALAVKGGLFADAGAAGAITSPVIGRVFAVYGTSIQVELL